MKEYGGLYRVFSCDRHHLRDYKRKQKTVVQRDRSFSGDLHKMSDILVILVCVESAKYHCYIS